MKNTKYTSSLFESIRETLNKKSDSGNAAFKDFLKMEVGNTYVVRLVPNPNDPERTIFHYYSHIWKSVVTNQVVSTLCPNTYGEGCPIDEYRSKVYASKNQDAIDATKDIKRNENWLVNVYVVKDPTNPENQGQVKVLRFGKQLMKIITEAISGEDAEDFGERIFDLTDKGCSLRIKVEENEGGYASYISSKFLSPSALEGVTDLDEIYAQVKNLDGIQEHKTKEEISKMLKVHFLGQESVEAAPVAKVADEEEEEYTLPKPTANTEDTGAITEDTSAEEADAKIKSILDDL